MTLYLLVYIIGHLLAYVLLPIALRRAEVIAAWPAWLLAASSPLTIAMFVTRQPALFVAVCVAFIVPSAIIAVAALRGCQSARTYSARGVVTARLWSSAGSGTCPDWR